MIKPREAMTREELFDENDRLRQQLTEHEETIEQLQDANAALIAELAQLKLEMEAVGAGGVSLMGDS